MVTLERNSGELAQLFGLKIGHQIDVNIYNTKWASVKVKNLVLVKFDRGQVGYSAS